MTITPYAAGGMLISVGAGSLGLLVVLYAIIRDWRFWLLGILAYTIGFWST